MYKAQMYQTYCIPLDQMINDRKSWVFLA